ncbi:FxSxx-COOH system tetratricopeptide repeat protein [Actinocrispum wychmicini]|uniref:FxSxx-COOH system tetratricopeptide repeat protein n=1 Tax=Actinocrispum wychmicini TaxID=1213861 RepID=UPI001FB600D6|nr:FxSxx-COOH system tetratricopeptide repeat protein [Actinocrispum wychmicini]
MWATGRLDLLVWVAAGSREAIVASYARVAADLTGIVDPNPDHGAQRLLERLGGMSARWLVVLDDVQSPAHLRGLWPPTTSAGRVVVTTRRRDAALHGPHRHLIEVGVFTPPEAHAYLDGALAHQPHLLDGARDLAKELGYLPLALAQANAYLRDRNLTCADYRARLADRRRELASLLPESDGLPDEHRATVAVTWSLSVEQANLLRPIGVAEPLLQVASLLDANGIPRDVFTDPAILEWIATSTGRPVSAEDAVDGLGCLQRLSLITLDPRASSRAIRVHALVQRVTGDALPESQLPVVVRAVADALLHVWPNVERDTVLGQVLRTNTEALIEAGGSHLWASDVHRVCFRAGNSLGDSGAVAQARDYFERLHTAVIDRLGPDHLDTLTIRHNIARSRGHAGDPAGAVAALQELLTDQLRVLGPDHPHTLTTRHNIAYWRGQAGDPAGAMAALQELLTDRLRVLGADHPHTLTARHNIARSRGHAGDPAGAMAAFEEVLTDRLRVLGADHPDTLITRHNIAYWRGQAGDPAGAAAALQELLTDQLRVLGPDHPHTLTTRSNIARSRGHAGDPAGAMAALQELLTDQLRVLGADHPDTLITRHNIAYWRGQAGDPAGAAAAFEELLVDQLRVLGADHPHTLTTRSNIAYWRKRIPGGDASV